MRAKPCAQQALAHRERATTAQHTRHGAHSRPAHCKRTPASLVRSRAPQPVGVIKHTACVKGPPPGAAGGPQHPNMPVCACTLRALARRPAPSRHPPTASPMHHSSMQHGLSGITGTQPHTCPGLDAHRLCVHVPAVRPRERRSACDGRAPETARAWGCGRASMRPAGIASSAGKRHHAHTQQCITRNTSAPPRSAQAGVWCSGERRFRRGGADAAELAH
jgi:hypothetical protein